MVRVIFVIDIPPSFPRVIRAHPGRAPPARPSSSPTSPFFPSSSSTSFTTFLGLLTAIDGFCASMGLRVRAYLPRSSFRLLVSCRLTVALFRRRPWPLASVRAFGGIDQLVSLLDISGLSLFIFVFRTFGDASTFKPLSRFQCHAQPPPPLHSYFCFLSIIVFSVPSRCRAFVVTRRVVLQKIFRQMPCFRSHVAGTRNTSSWPGRVIRRLLLPLRRRCASPRHSLSFCVLHTPVRLRYTLHCIYACDSQSFETLLPSSLRTWHASSFVPCPLLASHCPTYCSLYASRLNAYYFSETL